MRFRISALIMAICALIASTTAALAAPACTLPSSLPAAHAQKTSTPRNAPTGGYLLSLSWSPEYCYNAKAHPHDGAADIAIQCSLNHFAFVLHGLWPDGTAKDNWPQYCHAVSPVSAATVRGMLCRTPSVSDVEHEWEKHGSCGWPTAEAYFTQSARLMDKIKLPDLSGLTKGQVNASAIRAAFVAANPNLPRESIGLAVNKGHWFEEARICLDTGFHYRPCPAYNFGAADGDAVKVSRVR